MFLKSNITPISRIENIVDVQRVTIGFKNYWPFFLLGKCCWMTQLIKTNTTQDNFMNKNKYDQGALIN